MKIRFGIILLPLLLPFIYASAHFPDKKDTLHNLGYSPVQKSRVGLKASLYALAHARSYIKTDPKEEVQRVPVYTEFGVKDSDELMQLIKTYMPHKNYTGPARAYRKHSKESAHNWRAQPSRKTQREALKEQNAKPLNKAAPVAPQSPSPKRQTKSFSLNKTPA